MTNKQLILDMEDAIEDAMEDTSVHELDPEKDFTWDGDGSSAIADENDNGVIDYD